MARFQRTVIWNAFFFSAFLLAAHAFADGEGVHRRVGNRVALPDHVVAYAALDALENGSGWGRFVLRDDLLPSGEERTVRVALYGLEPGTRYLVEADGVEIGAVSTDRKGDGSLKLKTRGRGLDTVPSDLPSAADIIGASVRDDYGEVVLEGLFTVIREHIMDPIVHREKIHLEDVNDGGAEGMAAVCRKASGAQAFATMATGLVPGLLYAIVVDALEVGIVTADEEGQAGLELHAPAEEDALPDALQPVDNIRTVEWFEGELLILSGVFSGESDSLCHELKGWFAGLTEDGFVLKKGAVEVEIVVTDDTEFEGFDDLGELEEGDRLEVEVCADGERIVARSVELEDRERECGEFRGTFAGLTDGGFMLLKGDHELEVTVTDETELEGFDDLGELEEGDRLEVEGCWDGERFVARSVERDEHELECFKVRGEVIELTGDGFVLQAGEETVEVVITEETTLYRFESLEDLEVGDEMMAFGCFDGGVLVAKWAKRIVEDHCAALRGVVGDRTDRGFALQVGDDLVEVAVTDETVLRGFASLDELDGGEMIVVEGCFEGDVLVAVWIKLIEDDDCVEVRGVVLERNGDRLWVEIGDEVVEVVVTDETWFKEFESLDELDGGEVVVLEGCFEGEVLVAKWIRLLEDDDEPEWWEVDGTVVGFLDNGIVLSADGETIDVVFTEDTDFVDYENADQIAEGDVVFVEGPCDGEVLIAARVVLIEHGG